MAVPPNFLEHAYRSGGEPVPEGSPPLPRSNTELATPSCHLPSRDLPASICSGTWRPRRHRRVVGGRRIVRVAEPTGYIYLVARGLGRRCSRPKCRWKRWHFAGLTTAILWHLSMTRHTLYRVAMFETGTRTCKCRLLTKTLAR
jgi:hypothetical protein